ncbi:MAG TPA: PQQ-binding-like beta-propeller repeat protein [Trebonia sp.]|nr:PQQ-binding-like beta-propeller repeat protein [Trebonia sp.]
MSPGGRPRPHRGRFQLAGIVLATAALAAACSSGGGTTTGSGSPSAASGSAAAAPSAGTVSGTASGTGADWPEFDQNGARTGAAAGVPAPGRLAVAWTAGLDGAVYGQPLVIGGHVIAATEDDSIYALSRTTGQVVWRTHVGTPVPREDLHGCGNIFPLGITGTPVYDPGNGLVYAVAEVTGYQHLLVGVDAATGTVRVRRALDDPTASNQPGYNQQRPALAIDDGRVYATFGGLSGDCGPYQGSVVSAPLAGDGPLARWQVPTSREGAIWATGGPVVGPDGNLWVSVGNGAAEAGDGYDGSDSVTELTPALQRVAFFAPSTWADDNAHDLDLGSTQPVLAAGGTVFIMGKRGTGYLLSASRPGGIGGQLAQQNVCQAFGTAAVTGSTVYEPCKDGPLAAVDVDAATRTIKVLWRGPSGSNGTPVVGGGAVWVTQYSDSGGPGILYALSQATGQVEQQIAIGQGLPHFSSLSLSGGTAYVSTLTGVTAVNGA